MKLNEVLGVYWNSAIGEVDGQTFYAYSNDANHTPPEFPSVIWNGVEFKSQKLSGKDWVVWLWDIKFDKPPVNWLSNVEKTLLYFIANKFVVSWCGVDGCFSEPPGLFDPDEMSEGVYAAMGRDKNFVCHTDYNCEYMPLAADDLIKLKGML